MTNIIDEVAEAIYQWWMDDMPPHGKTEIPYEEWGDKDYFRRCAKAAIEAYEMRLRSAEIIHSAYEEIKGVDSDMPVGMGYNHRLKVLVSCAIEAAIEKARNQ
jgi:hypothetical protein